MLACCCSGTTKSTTATLDKKYYSAIYDTDDELTAKHVRILHRANNFIRDLRLYTRTRQQLSGSGPPDITPVWSEDPPFSMGDEELYTLFFIPPKCGTIEYVFSDV